MARWKKMGLSAGVKTVLNRTYIISEAPAGLVAGIYFFPNGEGAKFTGFMNIDYQVTFNSNGTVIHSVFDPLSTIHEYILGYGFRYNVAERWSISSSLNAGRYIQKLYNPVLDKTSAYSGFDTMIKFGVNYSITR
jgi:hypothetical protein